MKTDTQTIILEGDRDHVFRFIADPENLPKWAIGFCRSIRPKGDRWLVQTSQGDVALRMITDESDGVVDFHMTPAPGVEVAAFSRVVPVPAGAIYIFTQVQAPGMPDEVFDAQVTALREELEVLRHIIRAQVACAA